MFKIGKNILLLLLFIVLVACSNSFEYDGKTNDTNSITATTMESTDYMKAENSTSGNMIYNGDFSNGTNGWYLYTGDGSVASMSVQNGAMVVDIINPASSSTGFNLRQSGLTFTKNKAYIVSFRAKADISRCIFVKTGMNQDPWIPLYSEYKKFDLTSAYKQYTYAFTMTEDTDTNSHLEFQFGQYTATKIYIDDVVVKEITDNNRLTNGTFSSGMQGWEEFIREGTFGKVEILWASNPYVKVSNYKGDDHPDPWDLELKQIDLTIEQGKTYTVSFNAWTRRSKRDFKVNIGLHEPPWTEHAGHNYFDLIPYNIEYNHLNKYSFTFTMENVTDYNAFLAFQCGGDFDGNFTYVYIDNVVLVEVDELLD